MNIIKLYRAGYALPNPFSQFGRQVLIFISFGA